MKTHKFFLVLCAVFILQAGCKSSTTPEGATAPAGLMVLSDGSISVTTELQWKDSTGAPYGTYALYDSATHYLAVRGFSQAKNVSIEVDFSNQFGSPEMVGTYPIGGLDPSDQERAGFLSYILNDSTPSAIEYGVQPLSGGTSALTEFSYNSVSGTFSSEVRESSPLDTTKSTLRQAVGSFTNVPVIIIP